jgi:pyruvate dehydrogenase E1 component alpha subunit
MALDRDTLLLAYKTMRRIRDFEERVNAEFVAGHIPGFVHLYSGEEAIAVGEVIIGEDVAGGAGGTGVAAGGYRGSGS